MLKEYPKFKRNEIEKYYKKLSKDEKKFIDDYLFYRKSRGLSNSSAKDTRRYMLQVRVLINDTFKSVDNIDKISRLAVLIGDSYLSNGVKDNVKILLNNLYQYIFSDWRTRFGELKCFALRKAKGEGSEEGKITDADMPKDSETEEMLKSANSIYWKTFLLVQNATGNRTIETRTIENEKITFNKDGTATIEIFMTKTGKKKYNFLDSQATDYVKKLMQEKKNTGTLGKYLFSSPLNKDEPISKNAVNDWFRETSLKATGRTITPYMWRHKKATKLYNLALNNIISKDVATKLMGHSESMSETYTHRPKEEEIAILKEQAFNMEISPEKKAEMEKQMELFRNEIELMKQDFSKKIAELKAQI